MRVEHKKPLPRRIMAALAIVVCVALSVGGLIVSSPKQSYADRHGHTRLNALIDAIGNDLTLDLQNSPASLTAVVSRNGLKADPSGQVCAADFGSPGQAAFDAAIADIGVNDRTLVLGPGHWGRPTSDIPPNVVLLPLPGALIDPGAGDLTIGRLAAGITYQIFNPTGAGKIIFKEGAVQEVYPEQWGAVADDSTDCQPAIFAALYSLPKGGVVRLQAGTYRLDRYYAPGGPIAGHLVWPQVNGLWLRGSGMGATVLHGKDHATQDYRVVLIHATSAAGITAAKISDLTIAGKADQPAVPGEGISVGNYVYDLVIDSVEAKWLRGSPYRHSSAHPGERHTIQNCYFHDCGTAKMTRRSSGSAGGIDHMAPKTRILNNRLINCGSAAGGFEYWHNIYGVNDDCLIAGNYTEGRGLHLRNGSKTCYRVIAAHNISVTTDFTDITHWFTNIVDGVIEGWVIKNGVLKIATPDNTNITVNGLVMSSDNNSCLASGGYLQIIGQNITINNPIITGRERETTQNTGIGLIGSGPTPDITTKNVAIHGGKIKNCVRGIQVQVSAGDVVSGFTVNDMEICGTATPNSSWMAFYIGQYGTMSDFHFDRNWIVDYYYFLAANANFGPTTLNANVLQGVVFGLGMFADPVSDIECIGTIADDSFTNPYNTTFPPSATRVYRLAGTRLLSSTGVITLTNSAKPYVWLGDTFVTGGNTGLTHLLGGCLGDVKTILAKHSVTVHHNKDSDPGNIQLSGESDFLMTAGNTLTLKMIELNRWQEIGRN